MTRTSTFARRMARGAIVLGLGLAPSVAAAQVGPGTMPGGGTPTGGEEEEDKGDGVAEAAPKTPGLLPTTPTLPPPKTRRNKFELFELDGYFRLRGDYFKNLNLGFRNGPDDGGAPFPLRLGCEAEDPDNDDSVTSGPCEDNLKSTNIRLRLEPRINVTETVSVHTQIDVLDNVVLGSTATDRDLPLGAFGGNQGVVEAGVTDRHDSIRVKRAWGEVETPLGVLKFGRQPANWGLGIYANGGGEDPINGGYDYDSDYGDTVDRLMFSTLIPGTSLRGGLATDWSSTFPSSSQDSDTAGRGAQPWDLDDNDDVTAWVLMLAHMNSPQDFRDAVDRGGLVLNYGGYFTYRTQGWAYTPSPGDEVNNLPADDFGDVIGNRLSPRDSTLYIPDAWLKVGFGPMLFELEAIASFGSLNAVDDLGVTESVDVRQWGGVGRFSYRALGDKLKFGFELGGASGDDNDNSPEGSTHISDATFRATDRTLSRFVFDPDYEVDLILFRELIGAVTNAVYGKPFLSYALTKGIDLKVANVTSFAVEPVATPGNATMYGTEFDVDLGYTSSSFQAGLAYGVLFPLSAMNHPNPNVGSGGPGFGFGENNRGDAGTAHTLQMRFVIPF